MMQNKILVGAVAVALLLVCATVASSASVTLVLVDTYAKADPFGLAFDGTNIWYTQGTSGGVVHEMTTAGVDTGNTTPRVDYGALAWDSVKGQLAAGSGFGAAASLTFFDRYTGANATTISLDSGIAGPYSLNDGLDIDHGEIWYSPDIGNVYRLDGAGNFLGANPVLGGAGGFSGVERVDFGANSYLLVVNDASAPRRLDVRMLDGTLIGSQQFANQRYEDLAFDGRYLWAADYFGNKIDKFDVLVDGQSIFSDVPEPGTLVLMGLGLGGLGFIVRRRRKTAA